MQGGVIILTMKMVVVIIRKVVIASKASTSTHCVVVEKVTTGNCMWSLIVLMTEHLTTMDDHIFVVVKTTLLKTTYPIVNTPSCRSD
jgi:hypothetical protein